MKYYNGHKIVTVPDYEDSQEISPEEKADLEYMDYKDNPNRPRYKRLRETEEKK